MEFFEGNGRMSKVVKHNGVLYLCGQTGTPGNNMKEQTAEVLKKVEDLLEKYGSAKKHSISAHIYIEDVAMFGDMNEVWDAWVVPGYEPTRAVLEASVNDKRKLLEVVVTAAVKAEE